MVLFIYLAALIGGLLMFMLGSKYPNVKRIGELLLFSAILATLIAIAPTAISKLLH